MMIAVGDTVQATKGSFTFTGKVTRIYRGPWANSTTSLYADQFDLRARKRIVELKVPGERIPGFALLKNCRSL